MIIDCSNNIQELKEAFSKVFRNNDPFDRMFDNHITHKFLIYPTASWRLSKKQYGMLIQAVRAVGESSFYLSEVEDGAFNPGNWLLDVNTSYDEYYQLPFCLETALYSKQGTWGVIISHEHHAVFGGSEQFIATLKRLHPQWKKDQKEFVEYFEYWAKKDGSTDISWIHDYLKYINE